MIGIQLCDRYQIQELLSDKAGRQTYLALDLEQNQQVVVKILKFDNAMTWDHFKLFEREAKTLQTLVHPAIPVCQDYLELDLPSCQGFALVQTYIEAESLEAYLQLGTSFSEEEIKQLAESVLDILTYLHGQHPPVIHRDIKPSNILVANRSGNHFGQVYLVDFGSVQTVMSKESGTITIVGSYGYIPFEQFCGQAVPASDLYSLGMTILYLATSLHPADHPQKRGEIQINNTGLSQHLEQWLKQMTSSHLDRRFADATSALNALHTPQTTDPISLKLKPENTKVQLYRSDDALEILFPNVQFLSGKIIFGFAAIVFLLHLAAIFNFFFILLLLPFIFGILRAIWNLFRSPEITQMVINETMINCHSRLGSRRNSRFKINRLCYARSYEFDHFWDSTGRVINRGKVRIEPKLIIYTAKDQYSIKGLTDAECWWLGQELSDFLNLELQIIYPIPKVPPEPSCGGGC